MAETAWLEPYPDSRAGSVGAPDPVHRMQALEHMELAFIASLQHLTGRQRAVLLLREGLGYHAGEVADPLDTSVAAVNSALQRARRVIDDLRQTPTQQAEFAELGDNKLREMARRYATAWETPEGLPEVRPPDGTRGSASRWNLPEMRRRLVRPMR